MLDAPTVHRHIFCSRRPVSRVLFPLSWEIAIHLGHPLPDASRDPPGQRHGNMPLDHSPSVAPIRSCSRCGLPCHRRYRRRGALLPHPFTLTCHTRKYAGGFLSVALSLRLPPPGVTRHRVSVEPGLSSLRGFPFYEERPSGRLEREM